MSNEAPTDALRLVPTKATPQMIAAMDKNIFGYKMGLGSDFLHGVWSAALAAAPASPLPGGGDWIDGTPEVPVGSPTWCGWASYEIRRLRAKLPATSTGESK